jgi:hypothetical protein
MAPAESSDYDAPLASEQEKANTTAGSSAPAVELPPPYVPRPLVEVAGKRVPIPLKRPKKG